MLERAPHVEKSCAGQTERVESMLWYFRGRTAPRDSRRSAYPPNIARFVAITRSNSRLRNPGKSWLVLRGQPFRTHISKEGLDEKTNHVPWNLVSWGLPFRETPRGQERSGQKQFRLNHAPFHFHTWFPPSFLSQLYFPLSRGGCPSDRVLSEGRNNGPERRMQPRGW